MKDESLAGLDWPAPFDDLRLRITQNEVENYREAMERNQIHLGLQAAFQIVQYCNSAIEVWAPWRLAKDPNRRDALDAALYCLAELLRIVSILIFPVMPRAAGAIFEQLAVREEPRLSDAQWGLLADGHLLGKPAPVFPRIETVEKDGQ